MATAILKSRVGEHTIRIYDSNNKEHLFHWNGKNNFTLEVPTELKAQSQFEEGREVVYAKNLAQHILDTVKDLNPKSETYGQPAFELVEIREQPIVKKPAVVDKGIKKGKKDEKIQ